MASEYQRPPKFFERYNDQIEGIIGTVAHVKDFDTYTEALQHVGKIKEYKDNVNKIMNIQNSLFEVDPDKVVKTKTTEREVFDPTHFQLYSDNELKNVEAITGYSEYSTRMEKEGKTPLNPDEYLSARPDLYGKLKAAYPNAFKMVKEQTALSNDEILAEYYKAANVTADEVAWYQENKGKYKATAYNEQLTDLMNQYIPYFVSRGQTGLKYGAMLEEQIKQNYIKPPAYKYEKVGDELYRMDEWGNMKLVSKNEKQEWTPDAQIPVAYFEKDGNIYISQVMKNKKGDTKPTIVPLGSGPEALALYASWIKSQENKREDLSETEKLLWSSGMNITIPGFGFGPDVTIPGRVAKKGGSKGVADKLDKGERVDKSDMDALFGDWYHHKKGDLDTSETQDFLKAKEEYKRNYKKTEAEFQSLMSKWEQTSGKEEKSMFREITSNYKNVTQAQVNALAEAIRQKIVEWGHMKDKGSMTWEDYKQAIINFYNLNKDKWYIPVREAYEEQLKKMGLMK